MSARPMAPAFSRRGHALAFCGLLAALLALPLVLRRLELPSHAQRLAAAPVAAGPYSFLEREIYEERSDLDLAFVGDSLLWVGIDTPLVARSLGPVLGRPARVV